MLELVIPDREVFVEETQEFIRVGKTKLQLEHSLISVRKWEQKWHKPFHKRLDDQMSLEELLSYIECMVINTVRDPMVFKILDADEVMKILTYIQDPMTATTFSGPDANNNPIQREGITAEIIYYWMIALNIPVEFEKWHLNTLLTLIRVVNIKSDTKKKSTKVNKRNAAMERARLNAERRKKYGTTG